LDFEARVPVPFSIFPSSYKEDAAPAAETTTQVHEELEIKLPQKAGREGQYSSYQPTQEEVHITREEDIYRRPGVQRKEYIREERRSFDSRPRSSYSETHVEYDTKSRSHHHHNPIDIAEREYRARFQPSYREETRVGTTVDAPARRPAFKETVRIEETVDTPRFQNYQQSASVVDETTVDAPRAPSVYRKDVTVIDETVNYPKKHHHHHKSKMGYYDDDGHYHSFRAGVHKMADRILHPEGHHAHHHTEYTEVRESRPRSRASASADDAAPNTVTIPCHHIRLGDILILQGRPCQVIRISTSAATGQHRYLGVDLFTKQLHEESSSVSHPAPSVVVQTMLGPVFKQYRVLDIQDGTIVAMTETGDVKQNLPVIEQSNLWSRLQSSFESGRGSVRVLVVSDRGRELAVDMKVVHGSRL
ncbi:hypothetical protein CONLIGDRAFT_700960, partial [Coniochaeta ligniaria NRRL 30616]